MYSFFFFLSYNNTKYFPFLGNPSQGKKLKPLSFNFIPSMKSFIDSAECIMLLWPTLDFMAVGCCQHACRVSNNCF